MDPSTWNLYTYCANNPVNFVDPSGHVLFSVLCGIWKSLGFTWDYHQKIFYTKKWCAQYSLGYCDTYDRIAHNMKFDIHSKRSTFYYGNKWWKIQFWKGRYGLTNGGEFGIYTSKKKNGWYRSAASKDMLGMSISLRNMNTKKTLFSISSRSHWWLNGFKPGRKIKKGNLRMTGPIVFKHLIMARRFRANLERGVSSRKINMKKVGFTWR